MVLFLSAQSSNLDFSLTDNIYNTATKEYDIEFNGEYSAKVNREKFDAFFNIGFYTPLINNYMLNLPSDFTLQFVPADNDRRTVMTGVYSFQRFFVFQEFRENNMIAPGLFIDHKEYANDFLTVKNSLEGRGERFILLDKLSSFKAEGSTKWMVGLPAGISLHMFLSAGCKINQDDSKNIRWSVSPLAAVNLFNSIGLSASYAYSKTNGDTLEYYIDDSFIDEYYFSESKVLLKATILLKENVKTVIESSYSMLDYLPLYHSSDADSSMMGTVEARNDGILALRADLKLKKGNQNIYFRFQHTKRTSTNALYSYSGNSFTFGIEF